MIYSALHFFSWQVKVVVAMRDLFQVVFELKKKEIEDAKTMLENKEQQQQVQKSKVILKCLKNHCNCYLKINQWD